MIDHPKGPDSSGVGPRASAPQARGADRALDNMGSRVSHDGSPWAEKKYERGLLRDIAAKIIPEEAVARCGKYSGRGLEVRGQYASELKIGANGAFFSNVVTCKSVWHCPVCAAGIAEGRRLVVASVVEGVHKAGGTVIMLTLTQGHKGFSAPLKMRKDLARRWQRMLGGKAWKTTAAQTYILGTCRAMEVTHGKNGWHPHLHVLLFIGAEAGTEEIVHLIGWLKDRWVRYTEADGYDCSDSAQNIRFADSATNAGNYMTKFGVDWEITHAHLKKGKGGRSPFQILAEYKQTGFPYDAELFRQYGLAFKGARQLTWSGKARKLYAKEEAKLSRLYKNQSDVTPICSISAETMRQITDKEIKNRIMEAAELLGLEGILRECIRASVEISGISPIARRRIMV